MKKNLPGLIALTIVGVIALGLVLSRKTSPYPLTAVEGSIRAIATASGSEILEMDRTSASDRGSRFALLDRLSTRVSGRPLFNDIDSYVFRDGSGDVHLTIYYSLGTASSVEIIPGSIPSKLAEALSTGLTTAFPALDCQLESP